MHDDQGNLISADKIPPTASAVSTRGSREERVQKKEGIQKMKAKDSPTERTCLTHS